jgi:hypothetical protein
MLRRDTRGAIMVSATFMAVFATAALWYVIGIGDAIIYRERVQDSADAVAFAGAVYHARGMNIIASLNIVMAALLGLVVAAKLLKFLNDTASAVGCGCIPVPIIGPACGTVCTVTNNARTPINKSVDALTQLYNKVGPALSEAQNGFAVAMPWIAEAKSVAVSQKYQPDVTLGAIASPSLAPAGDRKGLPVEDGDDGVLCNKVSSGIVDMTFDTLHLPGMVKGWVGGTLEGFVSSFCGGGELVDPAKQDEIIQKQEKEQIDQRCDWEAKVSHAIDDPLWPPSGTILEKAKADHGEGLVDLRKLQCYAAHKDGVLSDLPDYGGSSGNAAPTPPVVDLDNAPTALPGARPPCPFNRQLCEQRARTEIRAEREKRQGSDSGGTTELDPEARKKTRPKIVYHEAKNGNPYFQVFSLVLADDARATRPAHGVEMASWGRKQAGQPMFWGRLGWAQAEFYYDTDQAWSEDVAKYEAMWNLSWRARLRRANPKNVPDVLTHAMGDVVGKVSDRIKSTLSGEGGGDVDELTDTLMNLSFDGATEELGGQLDEAAKQGDSEIEKKVREGWNRMGGIH